MGKASILGYPPIASACLRRAPVTSGCQVKVERPEIRKSRTLSGATAHHLVVWNMNFTFCFHILGMYGNVIIPTDFHILCGFISLILG